MNLTPPIVTIFFRYLGQSTFIQYFVSIASSLKKNYPWKANNTIVLKQLPKFSEKNLSLIPPFLLNVYSFLEKHKLHENQTKMFSSFFLCVCFFNAYRM
mmetsp:Transcript_37271/g.44943  ORF Transcript_37271/g.44943 Transcript_37271/m.44943 type:complete len:99 (-) Transcript_37271:716-1012(-)